MLRYKIALVSVAALYFRITVFIAVGGVYCIVIFIRYLKDSYLEKFNERTL